MKQKLIVFSVLLFLTGLESITANAQVKHAGPNASKRDKTDGCEKVYLPDRSTIEVAWTAPAARSFLRN